MVKDIILADSDGRGRERFWTQISRVDTNGEYNFLYRLQVELVYPELTFSSYVYITETEYGGIIGGADRYNNWIMWS